MKKITKDKLINVRVNETIHKLLKTRANSFGLDVSKYILALLYTDVSENNLKKYIDKNGDIGFMYIKKDLKIKKAKA